MDIKNRNHIKYFTVIVYVLAFALTLQSQQYNFIKYSLHEGLPQSQVYAAYQDADGYIWFGTQGGGVCRFDGNGFESFSTKKGLSSNYINVIAGDSSNKIWIGTNWGLSYFFRNNIKQVKSTKGMNISALFFKNDSTIWVGTDRGIYEYLPALDSLRKMNLHSKLNNLGINVIYRTADDIWIGSNSGLWRLSGSKIKKYTKRSGLAGNVVVDIGRDTSGLIWIASFDGGIAYYDKSKDGFIQTGKELKATCLYNDSNNDIWVGTRNEGMYIYSRQDSIWRIINEKNGLPHNHIRRIFRDYWGNKWICTSGGGVAKYMDRFFSYYSAASGLGGRYIYALAQDTASGIIISVSNNGLVRYDGQKFDKIKSDQNYINVKSKALLIDKTGRIWVGTEGKGLVVLDSNSYFVLDKKHGFIADWIKCLERDTMDNIWVATYTDGIVKVVKKDSVSFDYIYYSRKQGLPDSYISTLKKSPDNKIWFATRYGRAGYFERDKVAKVFDKKNGLPRTAIRSIAFDNNGNIFLGTAGKGIYVANISQEKIKFDKLNTPKPLYSDNIYLLIFDPQGNLWAGSEAGVDKVEFNNAGIAIDVKHYGADEGFLGIETCQNAALRDDKGNLWFGTMNGLVKHTDVEITKNNMPPKIHFEQISLFYKALDKTKYKDFLLPDGSIKDGLQFEHNENHISFEFKAIKLSSPKNILYQWILEGNDKSWAPLSKKQSVDYSNLPPGEYVFRVQAVSDNDTKSPVLTAGFTIKKAIWQQWWFKISLALLLLLILWFWIRNWKKRFEQREKRKREKLEMEKHILQLEQKALQLQMNPHFIFNTLNSIQSLVALKDFKTARLQINNFATLMRGILSNSGKQKISLKEEIDVLQKYLEVERFCQKNDFEYSIIVDDNIDTEEVEIPPMIIQVFVENAIIHGISHLQKKGKIDIRFKIQDDILICEITDNGIGRLKAEELRKAQKPGHKSIALEVTGQRLNALKGNRNFEALEIIDLKSPSGAALGTKVIVRIVVQNNF